MAESHFKKFIIKIFSSLILVLISLFISVVIVLYVTENFLFDKFYYQRSITHGYWVPGKKLAFNDFGKRAEDIINLTKAIESTASNVLGVNRDPIFTIAVIGDSFVWGQGLREDDRFVHILEKKLDKHKPTKIISLASCGDSWLDNYLKYFFASRLYPIDLFIWSIIDNDLILNQPFRYNENLANDIISRCPPPFVYNTDFKLADKIYYEVLKNSFRSEYGNRCIIEQILPALPIDNSIYLDYYHFGDKELMMPLYRSLLDRGGENSLT